MKKAPQILSFIALYGIALYFEYAPLERFLVLVVLGIGLLLMPYLRKDRTPALFFIDIALLVAINLTSKYVLNPLFILLFAYVIMDLMMNLKKPFHVMYGIFVLFGLTYVLGRRFVYEWGYQAASENFLILLMFASFVVMLYYVRSYKEARDEVEKANEKLGEHYTALRQSEKKLRKAQEEVSRLARVEERANLGKKLHDTVGHELTGLIMSIEMLKLEAKESERNQLTEMAKQARDILSTLRKSVSESVAENDLFSKLSDAIDKFKKKSQMEVHCFFEVSFEGLPEPVAMCAYRTFLESLTNTAKHSNATAIWLSLQKIKDHEVLIKVVDNGKSKEPLTLGHGLNFMRERVWALGGHIDFQKDDMGFSTVVRLPLSVK